MEVARTEPSPDVAIIGGGIVGAAAAALLARAGVRVVLYERVQIAAGASGRNSGVVQQPMDPILATLYAETVALYRELGEVPASEFRLPDEPAGLLLVAHESGPVAAIAASLRASHPLLEPTFLEGEALRRLEPALAQDVVACRTAIGYPVPPGAATEAFARAAQGAGARVEVGVAARPWIEDGRAVGVVIGDRRVPAGAVLAAAGPWTSELIDPTGIWRPIRPLWGVVVETLLDGPPRHILEEAETAAGIEPATEPAAVASSTPPAPVDALGISFSLVTARGLSSLGSTFMEREPEPSALAPALRARGARFVPALASARIRSLRACARPLSIDGRPLLGRVPWMEGCFVAAGHGPWGISTGPGSARIVVDLILGRRTDVPAALEAARFGSPVQHEPAFREAD